MDGPLVPFGDYFVMNDPDLAISFIEYKRSRLEKLLDGIKEKNVNSEKMLSMQEQVIEDYYKTLMDALIKKDKENFRKMHAESQKKRTELERIVQQESDWLKDVKKSVKFNYENLVEGASTAQLNTVRKRLMKNWTDNTPECLQFVPTYCDPTPAEVEKLSKMLGGVVQCKWEIHTWVDGDLELSLEEVTNGITGLTVLPNGGVIAVDNNNSKVKLYTKGMEPTCTSQFFLNVDYMSYYKPWDCVYLPSGLIIVSTTAGIMVTNGITPWQLMGNENVAGLACMNNNNLVKTIVGPYLAPGVDVQQYVGSVWYRTLFLGQYESGGVPYALFKRPTYAAVNSKGQIIITDSELNAVFIQTPNENSFTKCHDLSYTYGCVAGVCVDKDDNIYVADQVNSKIISLTPDGSFHRIVLSEQDIMEPRAVTFDNQGKLLLVSCRGKTSKRCSTIKAFRISFY